MAVSALASGISGLKTSQAALNVIGDNLANLNTPGFKTARVTFSDELSQTLRAAQAPGGGLGGKNPIQSGTGSRVSSIDVNYGQGGITPTGRPFDLAIEGTGFFILTDGNKDFYTRVGAFNLDENNDLVDSATGYKVKATSATINVPRDTIVAAKATSTVDLVGNLDSASLIDGVNQMLETDTVFTDGGSASTASTRLNDLFLNTIDYSAGDTFTVTGTETNGTAVSATFTYGTLSTQDGTTLGELSTFVSTNFGSATASIDGSGNIELLADAPGKSSLAITIAEVAGGGATTWPAFSVDTTGAGDVFITTVPVFDAQGKSIPITLTFEKEASNQWTAAATMKPADGSVSWSPGNITFNANGSFAAVAGSSTMAITLADLSTQNVILNFGTANSFTGVTQLSANSSAAATSQDGYEAGFFLSVTVNADGSIEALFTNGQTQTLDQMQLATFANPAGLEKQGRNLLLPSVSSGAAVLKLPLAGGTGSIVNSALESSNVDIAEEFTSLIINQRAFQANARSITTADEVMQELVNIVR